VSFSDITLTGVFLRFVLGGGAVAVSYIIARRAGARWGWIFAAFPAVYIASVITVAMGTPATEGVPLALGVSRGALAAMVSNIVCSVAAFWLIGRKGWKKGLVYALLIWLGCVAVIYVAVLKSGLLG